MNSLHTIALRAITNPIEAKRLHEKNPLTRDLFKEEHRRKFRQVMSQLICLSTCPCAEWCYFYGHSLAFGGLICQHCCRILKETIARKKGASEKIQTELEQHFRNTYLYVCLSPSLFYQFYRSTLYKLTR